MAATRAEHARVSIQWNGNRRNGQMEDFAIGHLANVQYTRFSTKVSLIVGNSS